MILSILKETSADETRVAATPESVKKYIALGYAVQVEAGAGAAAAYTDSAYAESGAKICKTAGEALKGANAILKVKAPSDKELAAYPKNALLFALLAPHGNHALAKSLAGAGITAFSMELVPRITRAQSMDVLSSQSNLAGYKAVLDAAAHFGRAFPMMMTAAGTISPAKVFVMGAGVAGLQAIATARRLGAIVTATDVRAAAKEQVESLGAKFIAHQDEEFKAAETAGGYAKEMSDAYKKKQAELVEGHIAGQDIVITTALIPGRPAPKLVSEKMVKSMKPGSVIVDLAVEAGGNVEGSEAGKIVQKGGVTIIGHRNVPGRLATDASALYARNIYNLIVLLSDKDKKTLSVPWDDDIVKAMALTAGGKIVHPMFDGAKAPAAKPAPKKVTVKKAPVKKTATKKVPAKKPAGPKAKKGSKK
ncbi:MAG TPA: Re/Si-specific NAD(P)(+) transhydrogenase subunit alpha [Alphaproteobacteria bacterium]|nr:Re/Si-specific NAD(P)(+) transhydrogenase subunit alpha [Alphaproteobacteria bacterium]